MAEELGDVSKACKIIRVSRNTFYRYQEQLAEEGGIDTLVHQNRRVPNLKNRADEATERAVVEYAVEFPAHGQHRTINELRKKVSLSPAAAFAPSSNDMTWITSVNG